MQTYNSMTYPVATKRKQGEFSRVLASVSAW